jgi:hypothetical protein
MKQFFFPPNPLLAALIRYFKRFKLISGLQNQHFYYIIKTRDSVLLGYGAASLDISSWDFSTLQEKKDITWPRNVEIRLPNEATSLANGIFSTSTRNPQNVPIKPVTINHNTISFSDSLSGVYAIIQS